MPNEVEVSPIFSTSALRSWTSEAGLFLFIFFGRAMSERNEDLYIHILFLSCIYCSNFWWKFDDFLPSSYGH
jgi:hypothetical protein